MLGENESAQRFASDDSIEDGGVAVPEEFRSSSQASSEASGAGSGTAIGRQVNPKVESVRSTSSTPGKVRSGRGWWMLAGVSALMLTALTIAAIWLVTRKPSTVDQLVILTVPSGAEITLNSKDYGHTPVKIERLAMGNYALTITKEGFETVEQQINVSVGESGPLEFKLKPVAPSEAIGLPAEEATRQYLQRAEEALSRGYYGLVYEGSALNYADLVLFLDSSNSLALDLRARVRKTAYQSAQNAVSRGDLAQAQEIYSFLTDHYPEDEEARAAAGRVEIQLAARRGEVRELVKKADEALQAGHLTEPARASAYYYS